MKQWGGWARAIDRVRSLLDAVLAVGSDLDLRRCSAGSPRSRSTSADATTARSGSSVTTARGCPSTSCVGIDDDDDRPTIGAPAPGQGVLGPADPRPQSAPSRRPRNAPPLVRLPARPPADAHVPGGAHQGSGRGLRKPLPHGEARRRELRRGPGRRPGTWQARPASPSRMLGSTPRPGSGEGWLRAIGEVSTALLSGVEPEEVLSLIAHLARDVTEGAVAFVLLPVDERRLLVEVAEGPAAGELLGRELPADQALGRWSGSASGRRCCAQRSSPSRHHHQARGSRCPWAGSERRLPEACWRRRRPAPPLDVPDASGPSPASRRRLRWHWSWRNGATRPSDTRSSRTATGSRATCTTWSSSGCSPQACSSRARCG